MSFFKSPNFKEQITNQFSKSIVETNFSSINNLVEIGEKYRGKVRDCYSNFKRSERLIVTTDRLTAFDVFIAPVPFKGQILTSVCDFWFSKCKDILPNHFIEKIDPNIFICKECDRISIEVVVRSYMCGSLWKDYKSGKSKEFIFLPDNLKEFEKFDEPIITPSTKAQIGDHDESISEKFLLDSNLVTKKLWEEIKEVSLILFSFGNKLASEKDLILVDTKYEFGLYKGKLTLIDEVHTFDCSRYWIKSSYLQRFKSDLPPEMVDKQNLRIWLIERGFEGYGEVPVLENSEILKISEQYIKLFELITGKSFEPSTEEPHLRMSNSILKYYQNYS